MRRKPSEQGWRLHNMNRSDWPKTSRLQYATVVLTTKDAGSIDWVRPRRNVRWGTVGTIIDRSDAHGLCYLVKHTDSSEAWYEPDELEKLAPPPGSGYKTRRSRT